LPRQASSSAAVQLCQLNEGSGPDYLSHEYQRRYWTSLSRPARSARDFGAPGDDTSIPEALTVEAVETAVERWHPPWLAALQKCSSGGAREKRLGLYRSHASEQLGHCRRVDNPTCTPWLACSDGLIGKVHVANGTSMYGFDKVGATCL